MSKYVCMICGFIYDEAKGIPEAGIAPGTKWEALPDNWTCPLCGASKSSFKLQSEEKVTEKGVKEHQEQPEELKELSFGQMSALCSNLAKGCEKQYLQEEAALFSKLAQYYKEKSGKAEGDFAEIGRLLNENLEHNYPVANDAANEKPDRGALRALVWSEKVTRMLTSILTKYEKEKDAILAHTNIYVCEICGFIYIGDTPPEICPVCKVPNKKLTLVERG